MSTSSPRIVVTGVTGLVGRHLAAALHADGATVVGLSRDPARALQDVPGLAESKAWAGAGALPDPSALEGADAVVHLAGEPVSGRWSDEKKARIERSRVEGTKRIVEAIERSSRKPRVLVSASAMGYYGDRGDEELTEEARPSDDFLAQVCVGWEREAQRAEVLGVRVVRLRISLVLAAEGGALSQMLSPFRAGIGGPIGPGTQWWAWIHIDDLVGVIRAAIADDAMTGAYNAVAPGIVRQRELARLLGRVLHRPAIVPTPTFALKMMFGGFSDELVGSRRLVPRRLEERGFTFRHPELEGALTDLLGE